MVLLHPIFLIVFALLLFLLFAGDTMRVSENKRILVVVCVLLIIAAGGRDWVGADYPIYRSMYEEGFATFATYEDVLNKMLFRPNSMEIEWLYVLINKILYEFGLPFYMVTFVMATISITLLYKVLTKYSPYPALSFLFYFMPVFFVGDSGQMRQGLGGALCFFSIQYIIDRKLWKFLFIMFLALGFHKSSIVFIPAYWLVFLRLNANRWLVILFMCVILAPFEVYKVFGGLVENLMPPDVANAYTGYSNDTYYGVEMKTGFSDFLIWMYVIIMVIYDKVAEKEMPYYEYYRNLAFIGFCMYYILRGNTIFATRLPGAYLGFAGYFVIPSIFMAVNIQVRYLFKVFFLSFFLVFYYLFAKGNGVGGNFTWDRYRNVLWSS